MKVSLISGFYCITLITAAYCEQESFLKPPVSISVLDIRVSPILYHLHRTKANKQVITFTVLAGKRSHLYPCSYRSQIVIKMYLAQVWIEQQSSRPTEVVGHSVENILAPLFPSS